MNVVIRVDASIRIGSGHVYRCLTLAAALRERGATVEFACQEHDGHLCDLVEEQQFIVHRLPVSADDACALRDAAMIRHVDWLIVDHYELDARWERSLRPYVERIMVIDDLADRDHDCDLLLDQNLVPDMQARYAGRLPRSCQMLFGPTYALVQLPYRQLRTRVGPREGRIRRVCIFFGGSDSSNVTALALSAFLQLNQPTIDVDVVIGTNSPHEESIRSLAAEHANVHIHFRLPTLADIYAAADLAIGGAGTTSWERLCLGLPSLVVVMADNQRAVAECLNERGLVRSLGSRENIKITDFARALADLVREGLEPEWSRRCMATVDGAGADRVSAVITATPSAGMQARRADASDEHNLLEWTNDATTRRNSFSQAVVSRTTHRAWLREKLANADDCHLYIVETSRGEALGQVRFERSAQAWSIHFSLAPDFRGRGLARPMLKTALDAFRAAVGQASLLGKVKSDNPRSKRLFETLGFELLPPSERGVAVYRRQL